MNSTKKVSQIAEKELVSIGIDADVIITKLDNIFIMIGKTSGINSEKIVPTHLDVSCTPVSKGDLFDVLSQIDPMKLDYNALVTREKLNTSFVLV